MTTASRKTLCAWSSLATQCTDASNSSARLSGECAPSWSDRHPRLLTWNRFVLIAYHSRVLFKYVAMIGLKTYNPCIDLVFRSDNIFLVFRPSIQTHAPCWWPDSPTSANHHSSISSRAQTSRSSLMLSQPRAFLLATLTTSTSDGRYVLFIILSCGALIQNQCLCFVLSLNWSARKLTWPLPRWLTPPVSWIMLSSSATQSKCRPSLPSLTCELASCTSWTSGVFCV